MDRKTRSLWSSAPCLALGALLPQVSAEPPEAQARCPVSILDGGAFAEPLETDPSIPTEASVPFWRLSGGPARRESQAGLAWLALPADAVLRQPMGGFAPMAATLRLSGRIEGAGELVCSGNQARWRSGALPAGRFSFDAGDFGALAPRYQLELHSLAGGSRWAELEATLELDCPTESELALELHVALKLSIDPWIERALDREGERHTGFAPHLFDADSGARTMSQAVTLHPLFETLLDLGPLVDDPAWAAALRAFLSDYLELGLSPATGLPRLWDSAADRALDEQPVETAAHLRFLLDASERGPVELRERAGAAAERMAQAIFEHARLPDGSLAASLRPRDGAASSSLSSLRRLDNAAQLARAAQRFERDEWRLAAQSALAALEFRHAWSGDWRAIDPGFDEEFGHFGARGVVLARAAAEQAQFRRFVAGGVEHFLPLWQRALRLGGGISSNQVRCWDLLEQWTELDEGAAGAVAERIALALRLHWKGQQFANGQWGDVAFNDFDPELELALGDLPGLPANFLRGLAIAYEAGAPARSAEVRARFAAVLRQTQASYAGPFGYRNGARATLGANPAVGSMRLAPALARMLRALRAQRARSR